MTYNFRPVYHPIVPWLICFALGVAMVLPFGSWLAWSFGLPVHSLLSSEGLRWLAVHAIDECFSYTLPVLMLMISAIGVWIQVLRHPAIPAMRRNAILVCLSLFLFMVALALLAALHPASPLLNINGTLHRSAFNWALFPYMALCSAFLGVVYGILVDHYRSMAQLVESLAYGICLNSVHIVFFMIFFFDILGVLYILGI